ncbi:hypothetical protein A4W93_11965 [Piscinibacter gummiphilus]|uniref:histidine kinase n=2 Tax=Piscinibacter gummiphilus TaxID=946333 RepID=A0A1W6L8K2_9BURK|nr:hypothetical protein A4W93_11965 [Piscinibacter gummiphilus]
MSVMHTSWRDRLREHPLGAALWAGALALALSLTLSQFLHRDLLGEIGEVSRLLERQQALAAEHEATTDALLVLSRALQRTEPPTAESSAFVAQQAAAFRQHVDQLDQRLSAMPAIAAGAAYRDTLPALRAFPGDDVVPGSAASLGAVDAAERLARLGRALRVNDDADRLAQQAAMIRLRSRTIALTYVMCLLFTFTAAVATYGVLSALRERTTRREADAARREAVDAGERAQAASRDKSRFLGMLSHELLTPLQSIISSMDIIESRGRVEAGEPLFLRLREGTRALRARLSDLVDFAKMSAGSLAVSPRRFRLDRLVEEVIADHEEAVLRKDLDIHWEPGPDLRQAVVTDPRRVRQILDNLVSNAIKYTERGGVTVQAAVSADAGRLDLEVRDTGIGIAPDVLTRIFDPFYRASASASMADGSGLGLAVVRSLVDLLDGEILVESTPGTGTRFAVTLPLGAGVAASPEAAPSPAVVSPAVLVVDDAHDARAAMADVLRGLGYAPTEAGTAREALRLLDERAFTAVLLDIDLPDVPGGELARRIREGQGPNQATRLVKVSASHDPESPDDRWFDTRADKPASAAQLRAALHDAVSPAHARTA